MATIQARKSKGNKYWYIVESRRVNGKPRPITLAYLGKANDLLKRLNGLTNNVKLKSYSHGGVSALLKTADELDICNIINKHVESKRTITSKKPIRNNLTVGASILLASFGRACQPTSKAGWIEWAKTTSLSYLLRTSCNKIDSQHFWDLMDAIPQNAIEKIETEILKKTFQNYAIKTNTLFYDTTNFFTYIHTTNHRCDLAKRGRNKQKRNDLKQIGLALVVSRQDKIPLFHLTYEGNRHDSKIFSQIVDKLKIRLNQLNMPLEQHTLVFDRGNNSKDNLALLTKNDLHYVGALVPYQHRDLVKQAINHFKENEEEGIYRTQQILWGENRTIVIFISNNLRVTQISWFYDAIEKIEIKLKRLQQSLIKRKRKLTSIEDTTKKIIRKYEQYISYTIDTNTEGKHQLNFIIDREKLEETEKAFGFRLLITNRHYWSNEEIIKAYQGQSQVEHSFRDLKNASNLAVRPQFHWTDQKIKVHFFICVLSYLLTTLLRLKINQVTGKDYMPCSLINKLNSIRLATILEDTKTQGKMKAHYKLEDMNESEKELMITLGLEDYHKKRSRISGLSVYK